MNKDRFKKLAYIQERVSFIIYLMSTNIGEDYIDGKTEELEFYLKSIKL